MIDEWNGETMADKQPVTDESGLTIIGPGDDTETAPPVKPGPQEMGTLSLAYRESLPVLTVSGGTTVPDVISVENEEGQPVAVYTAGDAPATTRWQMR